MSNPAEMDEMKGQLLALEALLTEVIRAIPVQQRPGLYQQAKLGLGAAPISAGQTLARVQRRSP